MAEKKLRVHNLAKELEVESKTIIEKCLAEGIALKGHMDVVIPGLAATIREWFSEGPHTTAVEESVHIDLVVARKNVRPRKKKEEKPTEPEVVAEAAPVVDSPVEEVQPETVVEGPGEVVTPALMTDTEDLTDTVETPMDDAPGEDAGEPEAPAPAEAPRHAAHAPSHSHPPKHSDKPRIAAGPMNVPAPAKLSGPRVVRMDKPEVVDRPRPAARTGPRPPMRPPLRTPGMPPRGPAGPVSEEEAARDRWKRGGAKGPVADVAAEKRPSTKRAIRDEAEDVAEKLKEWRDRDLIERRDRLAHASGRGIGGLRAIEERSHGKHGAPPRQTGPVKKDKVELTEPVLLKDFSRETGIPVAAVIKRMMEERGQFANVNTTLDTELATTMATEQGIELTVAKAKTGMDRMADEFAAMKRKHIVARPPVVTVLGHVDHGKTTLLDKIRKTKVAAGEAGGITQHIGAYRVKVGDRWVTFLDTPGHTAFTAMRARGTNLTDVVVLVVAADDGVMPTTVEAINHAKAAKTTIVVALNKIDLPHDINKIYGQLAEHGLTPSGDWGGETDVVKVSAIKGEGIDDLLAHLATLSEVMELTADASIPATGTVIEAERSDALGNVARVLVQEGTLKAGDMIVCGCGYGRVRALKDEWGKNLKSAGPSTPVEVTGLSDVPSAGDKFYVVDSSQRAKEIAEDSAMRKRESELVRTAKPTTLEAMLATAKEGDIPDLRVILKADMQGSVDVLRQSLSEFPSDQVKLNIIHGGVGAVSESDVVLAQASDAIIVAFHVVPDSNIQRMADGLGVDIRTYRVIYNLIDDVKKALEGLLTPDQKIESRGRAEVRQVFSITRVGKVAGCFMREGVIQRSHKVRIIRDSVVIKDLMDLDSLRRVKDDVKEVKAGFECGIRIANFDDLKPGDIIESLEVVQIARKLEG